MEICVYCGTPKGEKLSCCGECHFEDGEECLKCKEVFPSDELEAGLCFNCEEEED